MHRSEEIRSASPFSRSQDCMQKNNNLKMSNIPFTEHSLLHHLLLQPPPFLHPLQQVLLLLLTQVLLPPKRDMYIKLVCMTSQDAENILTTTTQHKLIIIL